MAHEITRILRAFASETWFIDPRKAEQIVAILEMRAASGPRAEPFRDEPAPNQPVSDRQGRIAVLRLYGTIMPRAESVQDVSQSAALMTRFQQAFQQAAGDPNVSAIVLDIDSPGGQVGFVPETAAMIRAARRADRPIVAVANGLAASAAYWIASAADEIVVTPSGQVGSIGVYTVHKDLSAQLEMLGVKVEFIAGGPRKTEGNPFEPLSEEARKAIAENVKQAYDLFVADVAKGRGVSAAIVRADPESADRHFGGGRAYPARQAVALGMADRVETIDQTLARLQRRGSGSTRTKRARLALI